MIVGLLFLSMSVSGVLTAGGVILGMPLWMGLLTYPIFGSTILLLSALLVYALKSEKPILDELREDEPTLA